MNAGKKADKSQWTLDRVLPWLLLVLGVIVMITSIALSVEEFNRLKNPAYVPVCNLNPILSCTDVANSSQGHAFGIPNFFIGIAGYAVLAAIGAAMLAGARLKRWFWQLVEVGLLFAFGFMTWLQFQSLYRIGALCLFCMVLWAGTGPLFWYVSLYNLRHNNIKTPAKLRGIVAFCQRYHGEILLSWFLLIVILVLKRFWYYWSGLI